MRLNCSNHEEKDHPRDHRFRSIVGILRVSRETGAQGRAGKDVSRVLQQTEMVGRAARMRYSSDGRRFRPSPGARAVAAEQDLLPFTFTS